MRVLCLSANEELASLRSAVLSVHGVQVDIARSRKEATELLEENGYAAAVLCHSISEKTADHVVALFRERNPGRCVIFVARAPYQESPVKAEISICAIDGPESLVDVVLSCKPGPSVAN
jgi:DNA-binding response OmpR family regulator